MEVWKDIAGYEGIYQVSNLGRVKKILNKDYIMSLVTDSKGYKVVGLRKDKVKKIYKVHRLVAMAFISNENELPFINHKDEKRNNNIVDNLEWCDAKYNNTYGNRIEKQAKALNVKVKCITTGIIFNSIKEAGEYYRCSSSHITSCCKGRRKSCGELLDGTKIKWSYLESNDLVS